MMWELHGCLHERTFIRGEVPYEGGWCVESGADRGRSYKVTITGIGSRGRLIYHPADIFGIMKHSKSS